LFTMKRLASVLALSVTACSSFAFDFYTQAPHAPGATGGDGMSAFTGNLGTGMLDRDLADDFTVALGGWSINQVRSSWVQFTSGDTNLVTGANVDFYLHAGTVGTHIATATGVTWSVSNGPGTYFGRTEKVISIGFDPINLAPGNYFVHIQPVVNHNWFWLTSDPTTPIQGAVANFRRGPNTAPALDTTWPTAWTPTPGNGIFAAAHDLNFVLAGEPVPEPASLVFLGIGASIVALRRRRRTAQR
jgi:hypothetical protein